MLKSNKKLVNYRLINAIPQAKTIKPAISIINKGAAAVTIAHFVA
jgi:hypothetical protein